MSVAAVSTTSVYGTIGSTSAVATSSDAATSVEDSYELFLSVLIAQLENQSPLDPVDTTEMTSQLVQYSSIEQQMQTNEYLSALLQSTNEQTSDTALSFVGKDVTYETATQSYDGSSELTWAVDLPSSATSVTYTVTDSSGNTVYETTATPETETGSTFSEFVWSGETTDGETAEAGDYTLVATATVGGEEEIASVLSTSRVTEASWASGEALLLLENGSAITLDSVVTAS